MIFQASHLRPNGSFRMLFQKEVAMINQVATQSGHSSQILQFPSSRMKGLNARRLEIEAQSCASVVDAAAWYHQATIDANNNKGSGFC